ncbi:MAG: hypothetical protein ACHQRK_08285 [Gemmatimonadales bacterium]
MLEPMVALLLATAMLARPADAKLAARHPPDCRFSGDALAWTRRALAGWTRVNDNVLHIRPITPPTITLFDEQCVFTLTPRQAHSRQPASVSAGGFRYDAAGKRHAGKIRIPDGDSIPATLTSFAMPQPQGGMAFVMSLPSIWATQAKATDTRLLATAVFMHEFTHTQSAVLSAKIDSLTHHGLPADADDDVIQERFATRPGFETAYRHELDLLYAALAATDLTNARRIARQAEDSIEHRRAEFFVGTDCVYAATEDVFLTLEGTGQYASYRWLIDAQGGHMATAPAITFMRRGGRKWSQDEGLALFLVLDRLGRDWTSPVFGGRSSVLSELRAATG